MSTLLEPGMNLVGWTGDEVAVASIFEEIPALLAVYAWDAQAQRYLVAVGDTDPVAATLDVRGDLEQLRPGMGLWLVLGGEEPVSWSREVSRQSLVVTLQDGWNLVAWGGVAGEAVASAKGLGETFVSASGWDADARAYEVCKRDEPCRALILLELDTGDALWVETSLPAGQTTRRWWHRGPARFEFGSDIESSEQHELRTDVDEAAALFLRRYGIFVPDLVLKVGDVAHVSCGGYARKTIYLTRQCQGAFLHEFGHAVQEYLVTRTNGDGWGDVRISFGPAWLGEGGANYLGSLVEHSINRKDFRQRYQEATQASRWTKKTLREIERDILSGDAVAQYELATFAVMLLADQAEEHAVLAYYNQRQTFSTWEDTFHGVFGIAVDEFYDAFAAHRAEAAPPFPRIRGVVLDHAGQPLEGIRIFAYRPDGTSATTYSSSTGTFDAAIPDGAHPQILSLDYLPEDGSVCHLGWYDGRGGVTTVFEQRSETLPDGPEITISLPAAPDQLCRRIAGIATDSGGKPVAGAWVAIHGRGASSETNIGAWTRADGTFIIGARDGTYALLIHSNLAAPCTIHGYEGLHTDGEAITVDGKSVTGIRLSITDVSLAEAAWTLCSIVRTDEATRIEDRLP